VWNNRNWLGKDAMPSLKRRCLAQASSMRSMRIIVALGLIALVLIFMVPFTTAAPDAPSVEWSQTYNDLQVLSVIQTADGGYALAGTSWSSNAATFIKIDPSGELQWQKSMGDVVSVVQTEDLGFALFNDNQIIKMNATGDFESSFSMELTGARKGILTRDGDYVVIGNRFDDVLGNVAWLYKVDGQGNLLWNNTFTGGYVVYDVTETYDRGCALAGNWQNDFWLAKIDSNSNVQWDQYYHYGGKLDTHIAFSVVNTNDGGYVLAGVGDWQASGGPVPWLIKIDSQGHAQFPLPYGHIPNNSFHTVVQTKDSGYALALGDSAGLMRTDSSGSDQWLVTLDVGTSNYRSSCLIQTKDGGYVVAGSEASGTVSFVTKISQEPDTQPPVVTVLSPTSKTYEPDDIPLTFTVNEPTSWMRYSVDGEAEVTVTGNITLSGLTVGAHNLTVSAADLTGLIGVSKTIQFTIVTPFPTTLVIASIAVAAAVSVGFLLYLKRQSLAAFRKKGVSSLFMKQRLRAFANNKLVWTLTIIGLSIIMVFAQIFFPYVYYSVASGNSNSTFEVGISYVYERDKINQIYNEVSHITNLGFNVIRVNLICDSINPTAYSNSLTEAFFSAVRQFNIKVALKINNHDSNDDINYYLGKWGGYLAYVQVLNEPDVATSWDMGALFTDDEAGSRFEEVYGIVEQYNLQVQYYTNFGPAFLLRTNLPIQFSDKLDFVGFDVFMESFLTLSPRMIQLLQKITNKEVVIAEFGMSTSDDTAQSNYIIKGLNLFKSMGLRGCWIVYWNSADNSYGIRGRLAEQKVGEWIAQNA
jgi:hypothetical protein